MVRTYRCGRCGEEGHNRRTCTKAGERRPALPVWSPSFRGLVDLVAPGTGVVLRYAHEERREEARHQQGHGPGASRGQED